MKLFLILLGSLLLSACTTNLDEYKYLYSFHVVDHGHTSDGQGNVELEIEEEGEVFKRQELEETELNFTVTNNSGETIEVGSQLEIERFDGNFWELVETPEEFPEDAVRISIPDNRGSEYVISIEQQFLEEDELTGGTYRINNNEAFFAYFVVSEFSTE